MATPLSIDAIPYAWIRKELRLNRLLKRGSKIKQVRFVQEWLCYHGFKTGVDQDFGPATERQVRNFQKEKRFEQTGEVDEKTYTALVAPILKALTPIRKRFSSFSEATLAYARQHLALRPIEVGGQNKGPWVRMYMNGNEGIDYPWCAGFVSFILKQASAESAFPMPIRGSWSCDSLAAQAKQVGAFVGEQEINSGKVAKSDLDPVSIFLYRRTPTDWRHAGFASVFEEEIFETIEGNTNDEGHRDGYEACARIRSYGEKDFILLG